MNGWPARPLRRAFVGVRRSRFAYLSKTTLSLQLYGKGLACRRAKASVPLPVREWLSAAMGAEQSKQRVANPSPQ